MKRIGHGLLFLAIWAVLLGGCSSWRPVVPPPDETTYPPGGPEGRRLHRITLVDQDRVLMKQVYVSGDTLHGFVNPVGAEDPYLGASEYERSLWNVARAVPLRDVRSIERNVANKTANTVIMFSVTLMVAGTIVLFSSLNGMSFGFD